MDDNSDSELIIDETIIVSSDEEDANKKKNQKNILFSEDNIFHPVSITADDIKEQLFQEETNTCTICNESFRYNIGLIFHLEMEHLELKIGSQKVNKNLRDKKKTKRSNMHSKKNQGDSFKVDVLEKLKASNVLLVTRVDSTSETVISSSTCKFVCSICKKSFGDQAKWSKHQTDRAKFNCAFCNHKFCWESNYKKHLFKTHKLSAAVVCRLCSQVFSEMSELEKHSHMCHEKTLVELL